MSRNEIRLLLQELDNLHGVSGNEENVANYMKNKIQNNVDNNFEDSLGNHVFKKQGTSNYSIMIAAHMDEIGYIINHIDNKGFINFLPVGTHDPRMSINQVVNIQTHRGFVKGVIGNKPSHLVSYKESMQPVPFDELFIDVGTFSKKETENLGVSVGDYITISRSGDFLNNGKVYTGKSIDNRVSCAIIIQLIKELNNEKISPTLYAALTVQEEVGIRGAGPIAFKINPDIALGLDVTFAGGSPNVNKSMSPLEMGKGPAIKYFDFSPKTFNGNAVPKRLIKKMVDIAEKNSIPYQKDINIGAATDASKISLAGEGVLTGGIGIPIRYMHSSVETVLLDDINYTVDYLKSFIKDYH